MSNLKNIAPGLKEKRMETAAPETDLSVRSCVNKKRTMVLKASHSVRTRVCYRDIQKEEDSIVWATKTQTLT